MEIHSGLLDAADLKRIRRFLERDEAANNLLLGLLPRLGDQQEPVDPERRPFFAFAEGQGLSEHTVPFDALVYLLEGEAEIVISGKPVHLSSGQMIIMPANQPHAVRAIRNFKMILTMIRS